MLFASLRRCNRKLVHYQVARRCNRKLLHYQAARRSSANVVFHFFCLSCLLLVISVCIMYYTQCSVICACRSFPLSSHARVYLVAFWLRSCSRWSHCLPSVWTFHIPERASTSCKLDSTWLMYSVLPQYMLAWSTAVLWLMGFQICPFLSFVIASVSVFACRGCATFHIYLDHNLIQNIIAIVVI